jgi:TP901 family phage tail tape measure protein
MTIQVRVLSAQALAQLRALEMQSRKTAGGVGGIGKQAQWGLPWLSKWGNQVQWAGRQLIYNFTLPIAMAMGAATKFALENEKAMTRVIKVYGDGSRQFQRLSKTEIPALAEAFEVLSNRFGVHQAQVIEIAGNWAAAGASGLALAKSVKLTLETMVLGELEAADATKQLIAIQAQYGFNTTKLTKTIDILNMVENQTGASMRDLMDAMSRTAGVARIAGVDVEHLAAMTAALVPASGSAATAGNGLKTMISRILSPTQEAVDVLREMGIAVDETAWTSQDATSRIELLADKFTGLSDAQKNVAATVLGSRWQLNRLAVLMQAVTNENSYYHKALSAVNDEQKIFAQRQRELNKVLESNPQRVQQAWVIIKNSMADVIVPLLPYITYMASEAARLAHAFANMGGEAQKMVLALVIFLALIGPIARYVGSVTNLVGLLSAAFHGLAAAILFVVKGPFLLLAAGAAKVAGVFWTVFYAAFFRVMGLFTMLRGAMIAFWGFMAGFPALMRAWAIAVGAAMQSAWVIVQASFIAFTAAMRSIWVGFTIGFYALQQALSAAMIASWTFLSTTIPAIWAASVAAIRAISVALVAAISNPYVLAAGAVLGVLYAFRDDIARVWDQIIAATGSAWSGVVDFFHAIGQGIVDAFWMLPEGVRNALMTVLVMVRDVALQIYEWMSYLNPFARHSPSLVESVTKGMDVITSQYARAAGLGGIFAKAARDLAAFKRQAGKGGEFADERKQVKKSKGNVGLFDALYNDLQKLQPILARQEAAVDRQQKVVDRWEGALDEANDRLDIQQDRLDRLKDRLQALQDLYQTHEDSMQRYADSPIKGMARMEQAIWENELAQKRLRLEMLKWEEVNGSIDDTRSRLQTLFGDIEILTGQAADLRSAGAGSDVLGPITAQIEAMEAQAKALQTTVNNNPVNELQSDLKKLQLQGEIMDLEKDLKFDPMLRQIEQLINGTRALSFEDIIDGIKREKAAMADLEPAIAMATQRINQQQQAVDRATKARDVLSDRYDKEREKLDELNESYSKTRDLVSEIESALRDMGSAASSALDKASKKAKSAAELPNAVKNFRAGAGGNWPDPGGMSKIGREGGMGDQSKQIEKWADRELERMNKIFGGFDMFGPIKKWWRDTWAWVKEKTGPFVSSVGEKLGAAFGKIPNPFKGSGAGNWFRNTFGGWGKELRKVWEQIKGIFSLFKPDVKRIFKAIVDAGKRAWDRWGPELEKFKELWPPLKKVLLGFWSIVKTTFKTLGAILIPVIKIIVSLISHTLGPVFEMIIDVIANVIEAVRGIAKIILGIFTTDMKMINDGFADLFNGILGAIGQVLDGAWDIVVGIFWSLMDGIKEAWDWLFDVLLGHSIIPDIVNGIINTFKLLVDIAKWIWNKVLKPIYNFFKELWTDWVKPALKAWWAGMKAVLKPLWDLGKWIWNHVLKPVWDWVSDLWKKYVKPAFSAWWDGVKNAWDKLKNAGRWIWDNVLKPVWNWVKDLWSDYVKPALAGWWDGIKNAWSKLKDAGKWMWDNVLDPLFERFTRGWNRIKDWFTDNADLILKPIQGTVNKIVSAINWVIKGLNKLSELPGLDFHINTIAEPFAMGGDLPTRSAARGFRTSGARAIVGEGKANYPEYVIPTDPTYRSRAKALFQAAGNKIGMAGIPMHADGGVLGSIGDAFGAAKDFGKGAIDWLGGKARNAASFLFKPFKLLANKAIDTVNWDIGQMVARRGLEMASDWVSGADQVFSEKMKKVAPKGGVVPVSDPGNPAGHSLWRGGEFSNRFIAHMQKAEQLSKKQVQVMQGGFRPRTSYSGTSHQGDAVDFQVDYALVRAFRQVGIAAGDRTGLGNWAPHVHAVPGPSAGYAAGSAVWQWQDYIAKGGMNQAYNSTWGLAEGGIVKARQGGWQATIGEGGKDEAVIPLPRNWRTDAMQNRGGESTTININGNLEFPNITDGSDAEEFVKNLVILAKD